MRALIRMKTAFMYGGYAGLLRIMVKNYIICLPYLLCQTISSPPCVSGTSKNILRMDFSWGKSPWIATATQNRLPKSDYITSKITTTTSSQSRRIWLPHAVVAAEFLLFSSSITSLCPLSHMQSSTTSCFSQYF